MPKVRLPLQGDVVMELPHPVAENLVKQGQATYVEGEGEVSMRARTVKRKKKKRKDLKGAPENKSRR